MIDTTEIYRSKVEIQKAMVALEQECSNVGISIEIDPVIKELNKCLTPVSFFAKANECDNTLSFNAGNIIASLENLTFKLKYTVLNLANKEIDIYTSLLEIPNLIQDKKDILLKIKTVYPDISIDFSGDSVNSKPSFIIPSTYYPPIDYGNTNSNPYFDNTQQESFLNQPNTETYPQALPSPGGAFSADPNAYLRPASGNYESFLGHDPVSQGSQLSFLEQQAKLYSMDKPKPEPFVGADPEELALMEQNKPKKKKIRWEDIPADAFMKDYTKK